MKRVFLTIVVLGLTAGLTATVATANNGKPNPNPRAQGAPGAPWSACAQQHPRGSAAFRTCVRNAAKARAQRANLSGLGLAHGVGRVCAQHKGNRVAFRTCVRTEIQRRKAAFRSCLAQHPRGSQAFRDCIRAAKTP